MARRYFETEEAALSFPSLLASQRRLWLVRPTDVCFCSAPSAPAGRPGEPRPPTPASTGSGGQVDTGWDASLTLRCSTEAETVRGLKAATPAGEEGPCGHTAYELCLLLSVF